MSSRPDVQLTLRRLKTFERRRKLEYRDRSELPFVDTASPIPKLLLDTTFYIDELQGKLPRSAELASLATFVWHSTVTEAEMSALTGLLDPDHPGTGRVLEQVLAAIERRPSHRIINPDREVWREAGVAAGLLARLQQYGKAEQRKALNDALILLSAAKAGLTVLTRNVREFDLLTQLVPQGKALFYEIEL